MSNGVRLQSGCWSMRYGVFILISLSLMATVNPAAVGQHKMKSLDLRNNDIDHNRLRQILNDNPELEAINAKGTAFSDNDAFLLTGSKSIRALYLGSTKVSQGSLLSIATLRSIEQLDLSGNDIRLFIAAPPTLKSLNLSFTRTTSLLGVASLSHLKELDLQSSRVNDRALTALPGSVEILDISNTFISDRGSPTLASLGNLRVLRASNTELTDDGVSNLRLLKHLSELDLSGTKISNRSGNIVKTFISLRHLSVADTKLGDEGIRFICENNGLETLAISNATDASVKSVAKLPKIKRLELLGSRITANGIAHLERNTKLKEFTLQLARGSIDNQMVDSIARMQELTVLDLRSQMESKNLTVLSKIAGLVTLGVNIDDSEDTLGSLRLFGSLRHLSLSGFVTVGRMREIAKLHKLKKLEMVACWVKDDALRELVGMNSLEELNLSLNNVTDESIGSLEKLRNLKVLQVVYSGMTERGLRELKRRLPNCVIGFVPFPHDN